MSGLANHSRTGPNSDREPDSAFGSVEVRPAHFVADAEMDISSNGNNQASGAFTRLPALTASEISSNNSTVSEADSMVSARVSEFDYPASDDNRPSPPRAPHPQRPLPFRDPGVNFFVTVQHPYTLDLPNRVPENFNDVPPEYIEHFGESNRPFQTHSITQNILEYHSPQEAFECRTFRAQIFALLNWAAGTHRQLAGLQVLAIYQHGTRDVIVLNGYRCTLCGSSLCECELLRDHDSVDDENDNTYILGFDEIVGYDEEDDDWHHEPLQFRWRPNQ